MIRAITSPRVDAAIRVRASAASHARDCSDQAPPIVRSTTLTSGFRRWRPLRYGARPGPGSAVPVHGRPQHAAAAPRRSQNDQHTGDAFMDNVAHVVTARHGRRVPLAGAALALAELIAGAGISDTSTTASPRPRPRRPASTAARPAPRCTAGTSWSAARPRPAARGPRAAVRCDQYCYQRARTFFDTDRGSSAPTARSTGCSPSRSRPTTTTRSGRSRSARASRSPTARRSTPPRSIYNLQAAGTSVLVSRRARTTSPRVPDPDHPDRIELKIDQTDDMTFVIYTGKNGDPDAAGAVAQLRRPAHRRSGA